MRSTQKKEEKITYRIDKLIRDKHEVEMQNDRAITGQAKRLNSSDHILALKKKLVEEAKEVMEAPNREELIKELADVQEVLLTLQEVVKINPVEIEKMRQAILKERGGFKNGFYVDYVTLPKEHRIAQGLQQQPKKYPVLAPKKEAHH